MNAIYLHLGFINSVQMSEKKRLYKGERQEREMTERERTETEIRRALAWMLSPARLTHAAPCHSGWSLLSFFSSLSALFFLLFFFLSRIFPLFDSFISHSLPITLLHYFIFTFIVFIYSLLILCKSLTLLYHLLLCPVFSIVLSRTYVY